MQPFNAPISDRKRQKFGEYKPRYEQPSSMRPFDAPISDWKRELFGTYQKRYEETPSMRPFDAHISERSRELYGEYRQRWATTKVGQYTYKLHMDADGVNWVTVEPWTIGSLEPTINDIAIYQVQMATQGGWAGYALWRILIDGVKVYPFQPTETVVDFDDVYLGTLSTTVKTGEHAELQFRSSNVGDTGVGGQTLFAQVRYAEFRG